MVSSGFSKVQGRTAWDYPIDSWRLHPYLDGDSSGLPRLPHQGERKDRPKPQGHLGVVDEERRLRPVGPLHRVAPQPLTYDEIVKGVYRNDDL